MSQAADEVSRNKSRWSKLHMGVYKRELHMDVLWEKAHKIRHQETAERRFSVEDAKEEAAY